MANKRIYDEVDGLKVNAMPIGGVTAINTEQGYVHEVDSLSDGVAGPSDVDQAGQRVTFSINTTDVINLIPLLISTPSGAEWYGHESGAATYGKATLVNPVCHSGRFAAALGSYATITVDGQCRFANATDTFDNIEGFLAGQSGPTLTHPSRLWQPKSAAHGALSPLHVQALSFNVAGRLMEGYDGGDKGLTAVDVAGYGVVGVELTIRDVTQQTGPPTHDIATALMKNGVKDLVVAFEGVGTTPNYNLTLRNCKFASRRKATGRDWTGWTMGAKLQWRDPTGSPPVIRTLVDATPANRLIDFAQA